MSPEMKRHVDMLVGLNFVFLQDSVRSVDFRDSGNIETAVQDRGSHVVSPEMKRHVDMLKLTGVSKEIFATSFRVSVQIMLNMEETG